MLLTESRPSVKKFRQIYMYSDCYLPLIDHSYFAHAIVICFRMSVGSHLSLLTNILSHSHMLVLTTETRAEIPLEHSRIGYMSESIVAENSDISLNNHIKTTAIARIWMILKTVHALKY